MAAIPSENDLGVLPLGRTPLERALDEAEQRTLAELELVQSSLRRAVQSVLTNDSELANEVTARGREFDRRYGEVHDQLLALIARQSPAAGDLRLAMALLHVNDRAERMEAQCVNITTMCCAIPAEERPSDGQLDCLTSMAELADEQIGQAARAFAERDIEAAHALRGHDVAINECNRRCFSLAVAETDGKRREAALFVAMMARAIERVGDNAVDIGQQAAFVVTGRLRVA